MVGRCFIYTKIEFMISVAELQRKLRPIMRPIMRFLLYFFYETSYTVGTSGKLSLGKKVATANTLFNLSSGSIVIGDYTIFGQNVMLLTGRHNYVDGQRAGLDEVINGPSWGGGELEVPSSGYDIYIGQGCWIASGSIIIGGVTVGNNVIVAANAVVTKNVPDYAIVAGIPAKVIGDTREKKSANQET
jgi:acetyltransferase-like isoleucine patch superfamily enzyme